MTNKFKKEHSFEDRKKESAKILTKYPNRIPIIIYKDPKSSLVDIDKNKFLAPEDLTLGQFMCVIRKRIDIDESNSLYIFVNETVLATTSSTIRILYDNNKDEDGFLYLMYCSENVFGGIDLM